MKFLNDLCRQSILDEFKSISEIQINYTISNTNINKLRDRAKILIIDDDPLLIRSQLVDTHGFKIHQELDITRTEAVAGYDIILCDIHGVGDAFDPGNEFAGIEMIKQLRLAYPNKYLIFYSSKSFDSSMKECYGYVDESFKKKNDVAYLASKLDASLIQYFNPCTLWINYAKYLLENKVPSIFIAQIETYYVECINNNGEFNTTELDTLFNQNPSYKATMSEILTVSAKVLAVLNGL